MAACRNAGRTQGDDSRVGMRGGSIQCPRAHTNHRRPAFSPSRRRHSIAGSIMPLVSTVVKPTDDGFLDCSLDRSAYSASQTPQVGHAESPLHPRCSTCLNNASSDISFTYVPHSRPSILMFSAKLTRSVLSMILSMGRNVSTWRRNMPASPPSLCLAGPTCGR